MNEQTQKYSPLIRTNNCSQRTSQCQIRHLLSRLKIGLRGYVIILLFLSFAIRIYNLGEQNLWGDELRSYYRASQPTLGIMYKEIKQANQAPLFEVFILRPWLRLGQNEFWYRIPSVLMSILGLSVVYVLGKKTLGVKVSRLAIMFVAISPLHIFYSREMRAYTLFALLVTLSVFCLFMALQKRRIYWGGYILFGALSLYTHYHAIFVLASLGILAGWQVIKQREYRLLKQVIGVHLSILLLFLPWMPTFWTQYSTGAVNWIPATDTLSSFVRLFGFFFAWYWIMPEWFLVGAGWLLWVMLALGFSYQHRFKHQAHFGYVAGFVSLNAFIIFVVSFYKPLAFPRYFMGMLPSACLAATFTVVYYRPRVIANILFILLIGLSLFSSYHILAYRWTDNWRELAEYLAAEVAPGDTMLMFAPAGGWTLPFTYYDKSGIEVHYSKVDMANQSQIGEALTTLPSHSRVWIVQGTQHTSLKSLDGVLLNTYSGHQLVTERRFDKAIADEQLVLHMWLYTHEP